MDQTKQSTLTSQTKKPWTQPVIQTIDLNAARMPKGGINLDGGGSSKS